MDFPPLLDYFYHLENDALLTAFSLEGGGIRPDLLKFLGCDGAGAADGGGVEVPDFEQKDVTVI